MAFEDVNEEEDEDDFYRPDRKGKREKEAEEDPYFDDDRY